MLQAAPSHDRLNIVFTRFSTELLSVIPIDNISIVEFVHIVNLEVYYEIERELNIHTMNLKSYQDHVDRFYW